jgi:hypothetical protein
MKAIPSIVLPFLGLSEGFFLQTTGSNTPVAVVMVVNDE